MVKYVVEIFKTGLLQLTSDSMPFRVVHCFWEVHVIVTYLLNLLTYISLKQVIFTQTGRLKFVTTFDTSFVTTCKFIYYI